MRAVAVIAGFIPRFALSDVDAPNAVTAASDNAAIGAGVIIGLIAVIASLALVDASVAADFAKALVRAAIAQHIVAVVAFFITILLGDQIVALNAVTADRKLTNSRASITRFVVAIVADFVAFPNYPITAHGWSAGVEALIGVDVVTVITSLALLHGTVTAARRLAIVAIVRWVVVGIVAAFARTNKPIAATRLDAGGQAGVSVHFIAVVAGFIALIAV